MLYIKQIIIIIIKNYIYIYVKDLQVLLFFIIILLFFPLSLIHKKKKNIY